jgi:hypothetical protein
MIYFEGEGDAFRRRYPFCGYKFRSISNRIARWRTCWVVSSSQSNLSIRAFIISTLAFAAARWRSRLVFQPRSTSKPRAIREHVSDLVDVRRKKRSISAATQSSSDAILFAQGAHARAATPRAATAAMVPMTEFIKAGVACKCLVMFMPQRESV